MAVQVRTRATIILVVAIEAIVAEDITIEEA